MGHPFTLLGEECRKLIVINEKMFLDSSEVDGLLQLTVLCPPDLKYPFFPYENKQGINTYGCCQSCIKEQRQGKCPKKHIKSKRAITLVTTIPEYLYSLTLGYELVKIHEALLYRETSFIFTDFINFLAREKIRFSMVPADETAEDYASKVNTCLNLTDRWKLDEGSFQYNVELRMLIKLILNALAGKFIQSEDNFQTILVHSQVELEKLFWEKKIENLELITPEIMQVLIKKQAKKANRSRNVVIGAYILGLSKVKMSQSIHDVLNSGGIPMYSDTGNYKMSKYKTYT